MNKSILYTFFLGIFLFGSVQYINAQSFTMGPKLGGNIKDLQGKGATNYNVLPDFNVGFSWNYTGNSSLNFGGEILYSRQGGRLRNTVKVTSRTTLSYIAVPLLFKYYFWSKTRSTPFLFAGPQFSYLLGAHNSLAGDITPQFKKTDVSAILGFGIRMQLEKIWWVVDARVAPGITNISQAEPTVRNSVVSVNTSFEFGSKKRARRGLH
ncbi:porin family protein [Xanthocytophaga agilis]|uniref:Porin family protein n=1 Tax=Xanthocytophaga agilis TaxID=3048010 RepID=A0AAE3R959_9BACT|nr:porin family protein [Xanthocytophaga agilis]MDJ1503862.1 porin family protein [Xanthocytophaga agilis]